MNPYWDAGLLLLSFWGEICFKVGTLSVVLRKDMLSFALLVPNAEKQQLKVAYWYLMMTLTLLFPSLHNARCFNSDKFDELYSFTAIGGINMFVLFKDL